MKKELIQDLFVKFEQARYVHEGVECWSARELQTILGYTKWENFSKVIDKAKTACESSGIGVTHHFPDIRKMIDLAKGAQREIFDVALTRYACYLVAQNGDPNKSEVAFAQTYFAVQTRNRKLLNNGY